MNTLQISKILRRHPNTRQQFIGCVASDQLPVSDRYPYCIIANTDVSSRPGQHWVAIYVPSKDVAEYFDSYGDLPNQQIGSYLSYFPVVRRNTFPLQSLFSKACGPYCIYFLIAPCSGKTFEAIVDSLKLHRHPDSFVTGYCKRLF